MIAWWWWIGCAKPVAPAAAAPVAVAHAPAPALAPRLFDAAGLRAGFVLGTVVRLRMEAAGQPPTEERWEVIGHTESGCTIRTTRIDPTTGAVGAAEEGTSTWEELESHASFPADHTEIVDEPVTVPAGTFAARRYTVRRDDGSVAVFHFALDLPGPPVSMVVTRDGGTEFSMVLLERTHPEGQGRGTTTAE